MSQQSTSPESQFTKLTVGRPTFEGPSQAAPGGAIGAYDIIRAIRDQERRRTQLSRTQSLGVALTTTVGQVGVSGGAPTGAESSADIIFSVAYLTNPTLTFGYELVDTSWTPGQMPAPTALILSWATKDLGDQRVYTVGAKIGVVITGPVVLNLIVHWSAVGNAFRNPIDPSDELT